MSTTAPTPPRRAARLLGPAAVPSLREHDRAAAVGAGAEAEAEAEAGQPVPAGA
ncbi:hypothetical protein ACFYNW_11400 [Streptomyces virginiae]|uniref:hypothetical protein n=1 Tax=Streptomyces virginiae TaxID=1961 RepID=UPI0036E83796